MAFYKLVAVLMVVHFAPGLFGAQMKSSIIRGHDAVKGAWPWMAYIRLIDKNGLDQAVCGGTLLNNRFVLTSARCLNRTLSTKRSMVRLGTHELQEESTVFARIESQICHPHFKRGGDGYENDIALVKLKYSYNFTKNVQPVLLPSSTDTFGPSSDCFITGWGNVEKDGRSVPLPDPKTLQQLKVSVVSQADCEKKRRGLTKNMLCAADPNKGGDACDGDYGGPLMCGGPRGFVQAGIISFGSCSTKKLPGVYTRVSEYIDYIKGYINQGEEALMRAEETGCPAQRPPQHLLFA